MKQQNEVDLYAFLYTGQFHAMVNAIESGATFKNIKDRSKVARRIAREFKKRVFCCFFEELGMDPEKCYGELMALAEGWEISKKMKQQTNGARQRNML